MHVGIAGEVRCVVTKADGKVKTDTGFQKNLILNQGLEFFGGNHGGQLFAKCLIGSGNTPPIKTQSSLESYLSDSNVIETVFGRDYLDDDSGLYKTSRTLKYRFESLSNVNISEVGLASTFSSSTSYYLCTRALIKDSSGLATTITVNTGETLDIFYRIWQVYSTLDVDNVINCLDGNGNSVAYNTKHRLMVVGASSDVYAMTGEALSGNYYGGGSSRFPSALSGDLVDITANPSNSVGESNLNLEDYIPNSYKRTAKIFFDLNIANSQPIRTISVPSSMGHWQIRYGSVADDSPIVKTDKDTLTIPLEFSWGRYEGEL